MTIKRKNNSEKKVYDYTKLDRKIDRIVNKVSEYITNFNKEYIKNEIYKAYIYAKEAHEWQLRKSWEPYIIHPVWATEILVSLKPDILTIQACLLHDVIEDTLRTNKEVEEIFGKEVSFLCEWMEKLSKVRYRWEERNIWSLRKMFVAMAEDLRVVFIKLSDRLHNMKTLKFHPEQEKRERISLETLNIYSPIADRLWLYHIKNALDEECLKILKPKEYRVLKKELRELEDNKVVFLDNIKKEIYNLLWDEVNNYEVDYRVKSIYSIYNKLQKKWLESAKDLHDLFGIRIMVEDEKDCYSTLWLIHNKWAPLPKRFKDYIALPKPNGYKSLHTTVIWLLKQYRKLPTEIQIKTYKMKEFSDLWVAAHFVYKEKWSTTATDIDWVKELQELTQNIGDNDFVGSLKVDIFKHRIFVFTPKWDFINLPAWSTSIDFAYYIHTDLWNHITLAKVNHKVYPLDKELHNWDVVDIMIDKNKKPNPFWMSFVKTIKARNNIKLYLKKENKELYRERWKDIMNKYLEKAWFKIFDKDFSLLKILDWKENNIEDRLWLLEQVWNFSIVPSSLLRRIVKENRLLPSKDDTKVIEEVELKWWRVKWNNKNNNLIIGWEENMSYILWSCCRRKVPNNIVAHINTKWIITVHKRDCKTLKNVHKDRLLSAYFKWTEDENLSVKIFLKIKNNIWILRDLSEIIYSMEINVDEISTKKLSDNSVELSLKLVILDYDYLIIDRLLDRIKLNFKEDLIDFSLDTISRK
jgi:GTP diphosphokinase / guanosine-3',5'-bis(diphosphate) 3'-diphosphatase